jgi:hypothetical protein
MKEEIGVSSKVIKWEQVIADALTKKIICRHPHDNQKEISPPHSKLNKVKKQDPHQEIKATWIKIME